MSLSTTLENKYVNGYCVDDVHGLIESVETDPANAMTQWRVASHWQGGARSRAQVDGFGMGGAQISRPFAMVIDEPLQLGGTDLHANPQEYLLAALNACMMVGFSALCALHGLEIESLEVVTEGDIDLRGFLGLDPSISPGYDSLKTTMTVQGPASAQAYLNIHEMVLATSPNVHNITRPVTLNSNLVVASAI